MTHKKSFIIHIDSLDVLTELTDEQAGLLFKAIARYQKTGENELQGLMNAIFLNFKNQFDRDNEKYKKICERNKNNGLNGGRPKPKITQSVIYEPKITQDNPKEPDNDNGNGSDNGNGNKKENKKEIIKKPDDVSEIVWNAFLKLMKEKKSSVTQFKLSRLDDKAKKIHWTLEEAMTEMIDRNWQAFKPEWVTPKAAPKNNDWMDEYDFSR